MSETKTENLLQWKRRVKKVEIKPELYRSKHDPMKKPSYSTFGTGKDKDESG